MQRFVLLENVRMFQVRLEQAADAVIRERLTGMLAGAKRELALLEATEKGVLRPWQTLASKGQAERTAALEWFRQEQWPEGMLAALIDPAPGLVFVEVNRGFELGSGRAREALLNQGLFQLFPDNPEEPNADGVYSLYQGLRAAAESGRDYLLPDYRYDVADPDGRFVERHWRNLCRPLNDPAGRLVYLLLLIHEVTDEVHKGG